MRILVLFGGESVEHEISIITANQVMEALSINHTVIPIYISKNNKLYYDKNLTDLNKYKNLKSIVKRKKEISIIKNKKRSYIKCKNFKKIYFDYAFPIVHGKGMEDGTLLAYLKFKKIPVVGDNLSFYAVAQSKVLTKRILDGLGIKNSKYIEIENKDFANTLSFPIIVKPNNLGSSIGVSKVNNEKDLNLAVEEALKYDKKVILEEFIENSKEYNISVVEKDGEIITSNIEEIVKAGDVLDYAQKYENGFKIKGMASTKRVYPAIISDEVKSKIESIAKTIYKAFDARGVIRIDFLYHNEVYVNEINSIPGSYSYYLWKGKLDFVELLDTVLDSTKRENFRENKLVKTINKMTIFENYKSTNFKMK